jgi:hypothetical protein
MNQKQQNIGDPLAQFVSRLVEEKGLTNLDGEILEQVEKDLYERVERIINAAVLEHMPPEKLEFFEKLLERSDQGEIQSFAQRNIPDLNEVVAKEMLHFRDTYLNLQ